MLSDLGAFNSMTVFCGSEDESLEVLPSFPHNIMYVMTMSNVSV
jgi:hypothetical protein